MAWCPHCNSDRPIQRHIFTENCTYCDAVPPQEHHRNCRGSVAGAIDVCTFCNNPLFRLATDEHSYKTFAAAEQEQCTKCGTAIHLVTAARLGGRCVKCDNKRKWLGNCGCGCGCLGLVLAILFLIANSVPEMNDARIRNDRTKRPVQSAPTSKQVKASSISPDPFIEKLESFGLRQDIRWKKSRVDPGWISQIRCFVDPSGRKTHEASDPDGDLYNELNCQLTGPDASSVTLVEIEVEIYDKTAEKKTIEFGIQMIGLCLPSRPDEISESFGNGTELSLPNWKVEKETHDAGYEIRLTHTPSGTNAG